MAPLYSLFNLYFSPRAWRILRLPFSFTYGEFISYRNHVALSGFIFPRPLPFPFRVYVTVSPGPIRILLLRKKVTDVAGFIKAFPLRGRFQRDNHSFTGTWLSFFYANIQLASVYGNCFNITLRGRCIMHFYL